jgi:DNA-binding IscR family transcriptional regulator
MSKQWMCDVWTNVPLTGTRRAALMAVAQAANEQGNCYLRMKELAPLAGVTRPHLQKCIRFLREERWLVSQRVLGQGGTLVYQLNLAKIKRSAREAA